MNTQVAKNFVITLDYHVTADSVAVGEAVAVDGSVDVGVGVSWVPLPFPTNGRNTANGGS